MNLSLIKNAVGPMVGGAALLVRKYSPEILMGTGLVGFVATNVLSGRATLKLPAILEDFENDISNIRDLIELEREDGFPEKNENKLRREMARSYAKNSFYILRLYAPSIAVGTLSMIALAGSHQILKNRNMALMAAYNTLQSAYELYRKNVREEFGDDKDFELAHSFKKADTTSVTSGGEVKEVKKGVLVKNDSEFASPYARFYDESSTQWVRDALSNLTFLRAQQSYFNDKLRATGHVFLNEVYDALGFERTKAGAVVGWMINRDGDNFVDFGIYDINSPERRAFVNGIEKSILLDFNVDGVIYDKLDSEI